jgi:hypothetical protein
MRYSIIDGDGVAYIGNSRGEPQFEGGLLDAHCRVWTDRKSAELARDELANLCQEPMTLIERY